MLYRYGIDPKTGKEKIIAVIYTREEHKIDSERITREVFKTIRKLKDAGYEAYIVGGAVRDLMLGRRPKDFDIATDAEPQKIRRIFSNSRVIGRRFKLCHVYYGQTILEVCTFRSSKSDNFVNEYGSIDEDAHRRDFSINALYYCPLTERLVDYVDGFKDFKKKRVRSLIDLKETFKQDPVRMIRAIKYSVRTGFGMTADLKKAIKRDHRLIEKTPVSRMVEEVFKIIQSGHSYEIVSQLKRYGLFEYLLAGIARELHAEKGALKSFYSDLKQLDERLAGDPGLERHIQIAMLVGRFVNPDLKQSPEQLMKDSFNRIKSVLQPLTPPNVDVEKSARYILKQHGIEAPKRRPRRRRYPQRRRSGANRAGAANHKKKSDD